MALKEYKPGTAFTGVVGRTYDQSEPAWPEPPRAREGAPNVLFIVLDDTGFAQLGAYGSPIETPNLDRLADNGLRYNNMHTTALCSPSRTCMLTGRNHHTVATGVIQELATGYPGYSGINPYALGFNMYRDIHRICTDPTEEDRRWFPFKRSNLGRAQDWFQKYGVWSLLLAWLPVGGDALTFVAGVMRVPLALFTLLVALAGTAPGAERFVPSTVSEEAAEIIRSYGGVFISDEVQTGWGRTGDHFWGYEAHGLVPDILTFAKGVGKRGVLFVHVLKNAMIPIATRIIITLPFVIIAGNLVVEKFFGIPGVGLVTYDAITNGDLPLVKAVVTCTAVLYVIALILTDIAYKVIDPRTSYNQ